MKRYLYKLVSEVLGNMYVNGQITNLPKFNMEDISVPKENFGDFSLNVAHSLARQNNLQVNDVADIVARELKQQDKRGIFSDIKVLNGFVNVFISSTALAQNVLDSQEHVLIDQSGVSPEGVAVKVFFEYSSPNTNKPLHIGHTRNDIYGMACINLLRVTGHKVTSAEIINDRGIHIMKSMLMYQKFGQGKTPESEGIKPDHFVGKFYTMFEAENQKFKPKEVGEPKVHQEKAERPAPTTLELEAQELLQQWEAEHKEVRKLWQQMNNWFYEGVKLTYVREGAQFDVVEHESEIYNHGREVVLEGVKRGIFQKEPDGSVSVDLTAQGLDKKYLLRKDGTTLYITQDMYLWHLRNQKYSPDMALVTTSAEQAYHFNVLSKIFTLLGYPWAQNFQHLPYEHVYLGNSKMSSRAGNTVTADDLFDQTAEKVRETMRNSQKIKASPEDTATVEEIALAAIKYGYLKYDRNTKIFFDLEETIAIEGNTGPYLQYTYARIKSIMAKAGHFHRQTPIALNQPSEQKLMRHLIHYNETIVNSTRELRPNLVCNYLFELSSYFNTFYDQVSVLSAETEAEKIQRLTLLQSVATVLAHGLKLLGIKTVEQM